MPRRKIEKRGRPKKNAVTTDSRPILKKFDKKSLNSNHSKSSSSICYNTRFQKSLANQTQTYTNYALSESSSSSSSDRSSVSSYSNRSTPVQMKKKQAYKSKPSTKVMEQKSLQKLPRND